MPGRGTEPGPALYPDCGTHQGVLRHRREKTRTCAGCREWQRLDMHRCRIERIVNGRKLVSTLGLRRRVRALARRGWGQQQVAEAIGMDRWAFNKIIHQDEVRRSVAEKVRAVYPELAWRDGPSHLTRKFAERKGWPGPMDWDDPDDPEEIPACVIERAHAEALEMERGRRKNETRRQQRRRWSGSDAQQAETMMSA